MIPLEQQVASLELSKKLKELGVKQESAFYWADLKIAGVPHHSLLYLAENKHQIKSHYIPAPTVAELGDKIKFYEMPKWNTIDFWDGGTEANARAKFLIYLIENGIVKP